MFCVLQDVSLSPALTSPYDRNTLQHFDAALPLSRFPCPLQETVPSYAVLGQDSLADAQK